MADKERDENAAPNGPQKPAPLTRVEKRAYKAPHIESYPLFERMALNCDPGMKSTGEDDFS